MSDCLPLPLISLLLWTPNLFISLMSFNLLPLSITYLLLTFCGGLPLFLAFLHLSFLLSLYLLFVYTYMTNLKAFLQYGDFQSYRICCSITLPLLLCILTILGRGLVTSTSIKILGKEIRLTCVVHSSTYKGFPKLLQSTSSNSEVSLLVSPIMELLLIFPL